MIKAIRESLRREILVVTILAVILSPFVLSAFPIVSGNPEVDSVLLDDSEFDPLDNHFLKPSNEQTFDLSDEEFGDQHLFWVTYPSGAEQILVTLLSVGTHCYVYMANTSLETQGELNAIAKCDELRNAFDSIIYPKDVELAGNPDGLLGDIDGDPKVTIFLGPFVEHLYAGRYDPMNELELTYSNHREMFMIDATRSINDMISLACHEFNHLIWFNHEMDEADFLVEGLANLAIQYSGYWSVTAEAQARRFIDNPQDSLLFFNRISDDYYWDVSYGQSYLFMAYLYERFGVDFVRSLVSIPEDGALAIDVALSNAGYDLRFNDVYLDWIVACTLDNPEIYEGIYGFTSVNYSIDYQYSIGADYPIEWSDVVFNYYGVHARKIYSPLNGMTLQIENPHSGVLGIATMVLDDEGWHVSQTLHTEQSLVVIEYIEGINVEEVYFIASLMSEGTPSEFGVIYDLDEVPSLGLDYCISERVRFESSELIILFLPILGILAVSIVALVIHHRRKGN